MWSILIQECSADRDILLAELWSAGTLGVIEEGPDLRAFFQETTDPRTLSNAVRSYNVHIRAEPEATAFSLTETAEGICAGDRFWIVPPTFAGPTPPSRFRLEMEAGAAFGTGRHESTQLSLHALETYLRPGMTVLDVGCGSGILSIAAELLGATAVFACDTHLDSAALTAARLPGRAFAGSIDSVREISADLVLANISAKVLDRISADLRRVLVPSGQLILAGFLRDRPPLNFRADQIFESGEWACWVCSRSGIVVGAFDETPDVNPWWFA